LGAGSRSNIVSFNPVAGLSFLFFNSLTPSYLLNNNLQKKQGYRLIGCMLIIMMLIMLLSLSFTFISCSRFSFIHFISLHFIPLLPTLFISVILYNAVNCSCFYMNNKTTTVIMLQNIINFLPPPGTAYVFMVKVELRRYVQSTEW
jgi:hypothetical protein